MASTPGTTGPEVVDDYLIEERRRHTRKAVGRQLAVVRLGESQAMILDISEGGMRVQAQQRLAALPPVLSFAAPGTQSPVQVTAELKWADSSGRAGVRFTGYSATALEELRRWLTSTSEVGPPPVMEDVPPASLPTPPPLPDELHSCGAPAPAPAVEPARPAKSHEEEEQDAALHDIAQRMRMLTFADGAAVVVRAGDRYLCRASCGSAPAMGTEVQPGAGLAGECLRSGTVAVCHDAEQDARVDREACRALRLRSIAVVPVLTQSGVQGVLAVFSGRPERFDRGDIFALNRLAGEVAEILWKRAPGGTATAATQRAPAAARAPEPAAAPSLPLPRASDGMLVCDACGASNPAHAACCEQCDVPLRLPSPAEEVDEAKVLAALRARPGSGRQCPWWQQEWVYWALKGLRKGVSVGTMTIPLSYFLYFLLGPIIRAESLQGTLVLEYMSAVVEPGMRLANYFFAFRGVYRGWNFMFLVMAILLLVARYVVVAPLRSLLQQAENRARPPLLVTPYLPHRTDYR